MLTAKENVAHPLLLDGARAATVFPKAQALLKEVGLGRRVDHRPDQLSGGEMQRVAIARALIGDPLLVLADEPTGNLDSAMGLEILNLLRTRVREAGQTVIMVTHDANAASFARRVVALRDGLVASDAPPSSVVPLPPPSKIAAC
jgi:putative ABC transport system ATP-binding protein